MSERLEDGKDADPEGVNMVIGFEVLMRTGVVIWKRCILELETPIPVDMF